MASPSGLWTSVSGSVAQNQNLDTISNNIANSNTVGFKKDQPTFQEYLTAVERPPSPAIDIPHTIFKDSDFYHHDGRDTAMVNVDKIHTEHTQGHLQHTQGPFDLGVEGPGFFAIKAPEGLRFTRAGNFKINSEGTLVTVDGYPVLTMGGGGGEEAPAAVGAAPAVPGTQNIQGAVTAAGTAPAVTPGVPGQQAPAANPFLAYMKMDQARKIAAQGGMLPAGQLPPGQPAGPTALGQTPGAQIPGAANNQQQAPLQPITVLTGAGTKVTITQDGRVFSGKDELGTLAVAEFTNPANLKKVSSTMYANEDFSNIPLPMKDSKIHQGFLEQSNVNAVSELVNLIKANRLFEGNMRAMKVYNDMAAKEANEVGKL